MGVWEYRRRRERRCREEEDREEEEGREREMDGEEKRGSSVGKDVAWRESSSAWQTRHAAPKLNAFMHLFTCLFTHYYFTSLYLGSLRAYLSIYISNVNRVLYFIKCYV